MDKRDGEYAEGQAERHTSGKKRSAGRRGNGKAPSPLRPLQPYMRKRKWALIGSISLNALATLAGLAPYWVIYAMSHALLDGRAMAQPELWWQWAAIAFLAVAAKGALTAVAANWTHHVAYDIVYDVRMALADKMARLPLGFFDRHDSGKLKHTVNEDVEQLEEGIAHLLPDITASTALPLLSLGLMFALDWRLALAVTAFIAVTVGGYSFVMTRLKPIQAGFGKAGGEISKAIFTYVYGMKVIRAFSRTEAAFAEYEQAVRRFSEVTSAIESRGLPFKTLAVVLSRTALIIVVPSGLLLLSYGQLTAPAFVFFILMSLGVGAALFKMLRSSGMTAFRIAAAMKNVARLLQEQSLPAVKHATAEAHETELSRTVGQAAASVQFANVSFAYNDETVLDNISFTVPEGSFTALVGPSGAGKTTIARLIPRFWDVDKGAVSIGGVDVRSLGEERLLELVSFVFQDAYLFRGTVMDNIRLGKPNASDDEVIAAAQRAACDDFIRALPQGYHTEVGEGGVKLSGGQRQRISLVRAVLKDAPIIVLDEATALLDPENEARIQDALSGLANSADGRQKTIIAIAHRLGTIVHADQIIVIDAGRVTAQGTHEELLQQNALYKRMWQAYNAGTDDLEQADEPEAAARWTNEADAADAGADADPVEKAGAVAAEREASARIAAANEGLGIGEDPHRRLKQMSAYRQSLLLAGEQGGRFKAAILYSLLENMFLALGLIAVAAAIYAVLQARPDDAWRAAGWMAAAFVAQTVFYTLSNQRLFPLFGHFLTHMRLYLGRKLARVPYGFFLQKDASLIESRVKSDASTYIFIPSVVIGLTKAWVIPPIIFAVMLWFDWRLALVALVGAPICLLATWLSERKLQHIMAKLSSAREQANSRILEYVRGIAVIRAYGLTGSRMRNYEQTIRNYKEASIAINRTLTPYTAVYHIAFEMGLALVLLLGGFWVAAETLAPEALIVMLVLAICLYEPLPLMDYALFRRMFLTTIDHLNDIILTEEMPQQQTERTKRQQNGQQPNGAWRIVLSDVVFGYGDGQIPVLQGISMNIPARGTTALVGPSGGGKTTILHLLARFWDVQQGCIAIDGRDIRSMTPDEVMKQLAFVFQDVHLFDDTIANNIRYGNPQATMAEIEAAARKARCHEFVEQLPDGYDTVVGEGGNLLSGGQKQRIAIARAILKDAPIILLDEATASVDPDNEQYIREAMTELARDKTVVIIAHRLHTVRHAEQIIVIDEGRVAQCGTHHELIGQDGIYRRFWEERRRAQSWKLRRATATEQVQAGLTERQ